MVPTDDLSSAKLAGWVCLKLCHLASSDTLLSTYTLVEMGKTNSTPVTKPVDEVELPELPKKIPKLQAMFRYACQDGKVKLVAKILALDIIDVKQRISKA